MLCGTEPFPELYRAKKYRIHQKFLTKVEFQFIMRSLPVKVAELEIEEMFKVADVDNDGKIGYKVCHKIHSSSRPILMGLTFKDLQKMVNPPKPPERPKPTKADFRTQFQDNSDNVLKKLTSLQTTCHVQESLPQVEPEEVFPSVDKDSCSVDVNASFSSDPLLSANLSA